ncbi:hypothetical protein [Paractinoplanes rishiriensis]|uniref:Uncharacterized protein n=1 Tax=Paractinoplanes rishiriensis TaxID=1050105 RepID=A0A919JVS4_9ACTN|nr:hypothetical protein [Actinoplanes rishiriensis]GIE94337.1 hypothetical protein Ari01nite_18020 [Actinoplanes rishiriensis]
MEILPGEGVPSAKVGEHRDVVEARIGRPVHPGRDSRAVYDTNPILVLTYAGDETVEIVELGYSGGDGEEVFFDGVQLTYRFMDDVLRDLAARGYAAEPFDIGYYFEPGFAIYSMGSRCAGDLDDTAADDDPRVVVEGVSVAPYGYFDKKPDEEEISELMRRYG